MPWLAERATPEYPRLPALAVPAARRRPVVDGKGSAGEYPGRRARLSHWEGTRCASGADCSATVRLARHRHDLYALFEVADDVRGAALAAGDCKRHWRTDSVELALDPRGDSDDTSTTFKLAVLPFSAEGPPCAARDADFHQGPARRTAPGTRVAATVRGPYRGYTVEIKIPLTALPARIDPERLTANALVYDSDTEDKTSQSRLALSPHGSAQADPYLWRPLHLRHPAPWTPQGPPKIPMEAARSTQSPPSMAQSRRTGVPPGAAPRRLHPE
ncbi:hypothetical protein D5H75_30855 [Bailinhaonella thermotolerans]|uniref:Carbohydrate-binding domain-containing protein n=2 Tax=Bailinhaonella thermotolerans TaxID=1070861 RepID=A0A3A4ABT7_9ACTN|nr:hypothetical protein D5H75_30855 [Bailinhaonella thermotolerans]